MKRFFHFRLGVLGAATLVLAGSFVVATTGSASAAPAILFVSAHGNDHAGANTCTSPLAPCATIAQAYDESGPGDTIDIGPGSFAVDLDITGSVNLVGAGPQTILDGAFGSDAPNISVSNLVVNGGGETVDIFGEAGHLTLNNVGVTGGGIGYATVAVIGGALTMNGGAVYGNTDDDGPGAFLNLGGNVVLNGVSFTHNTGIVGGAITNIEGSLSIVGLSNFANNDAVEGGAIFNGFGGHLQVGLATVISHNTASGLYDYTPDGGGIETCPYADGGATLLVGLGAVIIGNSPNNISSADPDSGCHATSFK